MVTLTNDQIKKIRQLELKARKIVRGLMSGDRVTLQKGFGLEFDQLAEYQLGDDIRFIDWKGSARSQKLLVKHYREELNHTIMVMVDISASTLYGSKKQSKYELIQEVVFSLVLAGLYAKDNVGVIFFSDVVESYIPPRSGLKQLHIIGQKMRSLTSTHKKTHIASALQFLSQKISRETLLCIVSDFIDDQSERSLRIIAQKHDVIAFRCLDKNERSLPMVGYIEAIDIETQEPYFLDLSTQSALMHWQRQRLQQTQKVCIQAGIDLIDIEPDMPFLEKFITHMKCRG